MRGTSLAVLNFLLPFPQALLEVVDSGSKNIEVAVLRRGEAMSMVSESDLTAVVTAIEVEAEEAKTGGRGAEESKQ